MSEEATTFSFDTAAFGRAVLARRLWQHKSVRDVADEAGVSGSLVSNIERGVRGSASIQSITALATWAGMSLDPFVVGREKSVSDKPTVPEVLPMVAEFIRLPGNSMGGLLHIVLDDLNVEDRHVQWCLDEAEKVGDEKAAELARVLLQMSRTQRRKLATRCWSFEVGGTP